MSKHILAIAALAGAVLLLAGCDRPPQQEIDQTTATQPAPTSAPAAAATAALTVPEGHRLATISVVGMHCDGCAMAIDNKVSELPGVDGQSVSFATGKLIVAYDAEQVGIADFTKIVTDMTYTASLDSDVDPLVAAATVEVPVSDTAPATTH